MGGPGSGDEPLAGVAAPARGLRLLLRPQGRTFLAEESDRVGHDLLERHATGDELVQPPPGLGAGERGRPDPLRELGHEGELGLQHVPPVLPGARMKLVGGDSGRVEREEFVSEVLLAPSERAVVDVLVDQPGQLTLEHRTPHRTYPLATITVTGQPASSSQERAFQKLRHDPELAVERQRLDAWLTAAPDKTL